MSRSMIAAFLSACVVMSCVGAPAAFGQIVYENVRYQYETSTGQRYYYGGQAPRVHHRAEVRSELADRGFNRYRYGAFSGGDRTFGDGLFNPQPRVYSDLLPYRNAARYGFTADEARNEAYRSAPRYFRKIDLLRAAQLQPDGSFLVPSHPRMIIIIDRSALRDGNGNGDATTRPATTGRILIIPKPKLASSDKPIVASR